MSSPRTSEAAITMPLRTSRVLSRPQRRVLFRLFLVVPIVLLLLLAKYVAPRDPLALSLVDRLKPPGAVLSSGSVALLGTDQVGRDILSRLLFGGRISLLISLSAVTAAGVLGAVLGLVAGYSGGGVDNAIMRLADVQLAFPDILLALTILAVLGPGVPNLILSLAVSSWVTYARLVRGEVLHLREEEFVSSAIVSGASKWRIMLRHLLPNCMTPILILASLQIGQMIIAEAALSFVGVGIRAPTPSWGSMIDEGRAYLHVAWWVSTFPGLAIAATVLTVGLLGDAIRDLLDPRFQA